MDEIEDIHEYNSRFNLENEKRISQRKPSMLVDQKLLSVLKLGLPACAGVAISLDRLLMVMTSRNHIEDVLAFD